MPTSLRIIGSAAFQQCYQLSEINIPEGVIDIQSQAFNECINVNTINIADSVIHIGLNAFNNTGYYKNGDKWSNNVLYIGNWLIEAKKSLPGEYKIKSTTKAIADSAFYECPDLTKLTIPNSVEYIGVSALQGCSRLISVSLPFVGSSRTANKASDAVFGYLFNSSTSSGTNMTQ